MGNHVISCGISGYSTGSPVVYLDDTHWAKKIIYLPDKK